MNVVQPLRPRRRARAGALAFVAAAVLVGSVVLATHVPADIEEKSAPPGASTSPARHFDPDFVYFPSQYELHAGPPEEHIQAF